MPVDYKRINAPENTIPYQLYSKLNLQSLKSQFADVIKDEKRADGRLENEHRKIYLKTGVVTQAKGSAYIELNGTKVMVSVFDPREIPNKVDYSLKGDLYCEFKYAPFSCFKRRLHQQDAEEKQYSAIMKQALEPVVLRQEFPNFQVDVYALVIQNDGSALSAAITAAGVALAHAGIPTYDLITSATISVQGSTMFLDPTFKEEVLCQVPINDTNDNHGTVVLSVLATHEQVSQVYQTGSISFDCFEDCIKKLKVATQQTVPLVQKCLVQHVIKTTSEEDND